MKVATLRDGKVHRPIVVHWSGARVGEPSAGEDMTFGFARSIAHAAKTRSPRAGAIIGSRTVSNLDRSRGHCGIAEQRSLQTIADGKANTPLMKFGDTIAIGMFERHGASLFGAIRRKVAPPEKRRARSRTRSKETPMPARNAKSSLPFGATVGEGFDLMKKMWGMTGLPGIPNPGNLAQMATRLPQTLPSMIAPTLDIEELDKRIADLRAVEQWLQLNAAMLRTTIQSLEVQRATIATLKQVGGAMLSPMTGKAQAAAPSFAIPSPPAAATAAPVRRPAKRNRRTAPPHAPKTSEAPLNPAAWWNTLQDQFTKIAAAATAGAESGAAAATAPARRKRRAPSQKS